MEECQKEFTGRDPCAREAVRDPGFLHVDSLPAGRLIGVQSSVVLAAHM